MEATSSSSSSLSSATAAASKVPSIVSELPELFQKESSQFSSSGGLFDSFFSSGSNKAPKRGVSISEGSASWKKQHPENGNLQLYEGNFRSLNTKDGNSGYSGELVEHTLLSSSVHYGGRDDYIRASTTQAQNGAPTTYGKPSGEDVADGGGSPRGNWWEGSYYY